MNGESGPVGSHDVTQSRHGQSLVTYQDRFSVCSVLFSTSTSDEVPLRVVSRRNDSDFQHHRNLVPLKGVGFEFGAIRGRSLKEELRTPPNVSKRRG